MRAGLAWADAAHWVWVIKMKTRRDELSGMEAGCVRLVRRGLRAGVVCMALGLSACASLNPIRWFAGTPEPIVATEMTPETVANAARASTAYERDPRNVHAAIIYARSLRELGSNKTAADVLGRTAKYHPENAEVMAEYAKALTAAGDSENAIEAFKAAEHLNQHDWSLLSAEGIALDQLGRHAEARKRYNAALKLSPDNPDILCNLALSHTLSGDLAEAELILRRALNQPGAGAQARQNLALVLGLRGRFGEAESLARSDLDPAAADHNVAVLRQMFAQPDMWVAAAEGTPAKVADEPVPAAPALSSMQTPAPMMAVRQAALTAPPSGVTGAVAPRASSAVAPRKHAPPSAQSHASGAMVETAEGNDIDDTFFAFGW